MSFSDFYDNSETVRRLREMLVRNRFPHAVILSGARGSGKYTLALMLARSQNRTAAVVIFDLWEEGSFLLLSAFGVLMFLLLTALSIVAYMVGRRFGVQEQY